MAEGPSPLVSVVIPAYNSESHIERALRSVLEQDYRPIEIVVVDDGSSDSTAAVARALDPCIRCVSQPNRGAPAARNRGIQESTGSLIAFLDSDDEWLPGRLAKTVAPLLDNPSLGVCYCLSERVSADGSRLLESDPGRDRLTPWGIYQPEFLTMSAPTVRKEVFDRCGVFDPGLRHYEDHELFVRIAEQTGIQRVDDVLVLRHVRADSVGESADIDTEVDMLLRFLLAAVARRGAGAERDGALADALVRAGERLFGAGQRGPARRYFAAAWSLRPSWLCARLVVKTVLPHPVLSLIRWLRGMRGARGGAT